MQPSLARTMWHTLEPIHALVYFEPTAKATYEAVGLRGGWMGYFASRAAALGPVPAEVVTATFYNFSPRMVGKRIPEAWSLATTEDILAARLKVVETAMVRALEGETGSDRVEETARLAAAVASNCDPDGRPLFAAHRALEEPERPHLRLWHSVTLLREHRGDGHVAALVAHEVSGLEANVMIAAQGLMPADYQQLNRGWSAEQWAEAEESLIARGLLEDDRSLSEEGRSLRMSVEEMTDRLAGRPYEALSKNDRERLLSSGGEISRRIIDAGAMVYPNPMGLPRSAI